MQHYRETLSLLSTLLVDANGIDSDKDPSGSKDLLLYVEDTSVEQ